MTTESPTSLDSEFLLRRILNWVGDEPGDFAVHAGHYMLVGTRTESCVPAIVEELGDASSDLQGSVEGLIAHFPAATWQLGVELAAHVRSGSARARLLILVNDWYFLRALMVGRAAEARREFYASNPQLVRTYARILERAGLDTDSLIQIGPHPMWVSEYWLRRRAERRLKRLKRLKHPRLEQVVRQDGVKELMFYGLGHECRRLLCGGQADCAEEVMELLCLLAERGIRRFVNFIPLECSCPVNKGCTEAIELFGLPSMQILNVALPCLGGGFDSSRVARDARIHIVESEPFGDGEVRAVLRSVPGDQWVTS